MGLNPKWLSHGLGSSLMEHTAQVLAMAETFAERVAAICHDVGKATVPWQDRARKNFRNQTEHQFAHPILTRSGEGFLLILFWRSLVAT
jgi:hypothetical protein